MEGLRGATDGVDLGVGCGVVVETNRIVGHGDEFAVLHNGRAEGGLTLAEADSTGFNCSEHGFGVVNHAGPLRVKV